MNQTGMEAIYQALLLIDCSPVKATTALSDLSRRNPDYLQLLKDMALQFKDRLRPHDPPSNRQFQKMSKFLLVIFNRSLIQAFTQSNNIYCKIKTIYQWMLQLLSCPSILFIQKKLLSPSLKLVLNGISFQKQRFLDVMDSMTTSSMEEAGCLFIYLQALFESQVNQHEKAAVVQQSYECLYYVCLFQFNKTIQYYHNCRMEMEVDEAMPSSPFMACLKETEYILLSICTMLSFVFNYYKRYPHLCKSHTISSMVLNQDLGLYLERIIKIEKELFNQVQESNKYGLKIIIFKKMTKNQPKMINKIKTMGLTIVTLILSVTDKHFNLLHTDKLLLRDLFVLTELIIEELNICSHQEVMQELNDDITLSDMLPTLINVLTQAVLFTDVQPILQKVNVECLIRLTLGFLTSYEYELQLFENSPEEYFVLVFYQLFGKIDENEDDIPLDLSLSEFSLKKSVIALMKTLSQSLEGFSSIMLDICCDTMLLEMQFRRKPSTSFKAMFLSKYSLPSDIFEFINLENALLAFTVLIQNYSNPLDRTDKYRYMLQTLNIKALSQIELTKVYVCLSVHDEEFRDGDLHIKYYHFIERVFEMNEEVSSLSKVGFYFLERLVTRQNYKSKNVCVLMDKILNDIIEWLPGANSPLIFEFLTKTVKTPQVQSRILNLKWLNNCLDKVNTCIHRLYELNPLNHEAITAIFGLFSSLIEASRVLVDKNQKLGYLSRDEEVDKFYSRVNLTLSEKMFSTFGGMVGSKDLLNEEYHCIYRASDFLFAIFTSQVKLTSHSVSLLTDFTMNLLLRRESQNQSYSTSEFKLLYQLINRVAFDLQQHHYQIIRGWLQTKLSTEFMDELYINQACIILQLLYFFMHGNYFQRSKMIVFFQEVTNTIEKAFLKYLLDYNEYMEIIEKELDLDVKKITLRNIGFDRARQVQQKNAVTIMRLYNTILLNPNFEPSSFHLIADVIKLFIREHIPVYDLAVQFMAISTIVAKSRTAGVLDCFRIGLDMLDYNARHSQPSKQMSVKERGILEMTKEVKSPITILDPYEELAIMVNSQARRSKGHPIFINYQLPFEEIEVDMIEFIKSDEYTLKLVRELASIRRVNDQPRLIRKIKRQED